MKKKSIRQFLQYIAVGGTCTTIDIIVLYLLTTLAGVHYLVSASCSFAIGIVLNWSLCSYWVFDYHKVKQQSKEFLYYVFISLFGLILNALLMWFFTEFFNLWFMISKAYSVSITLFYNFFTRKLLLHSK